MCANLLTFPCPHFPERLHSITSKLLCYLLVSVLSLCIPSWLGCCFSTALYSLGHFPIKFTLVQARVTVAWTAIVFFILPLFSLFLSFSSDNDTENYSQYNPEMIFFSSGYKLLHNDIFCEPISYEF